MMTKLDANQLTEVSDALDKVAHILETDENQNSPTEIKRQKRSLLMGQITPINKTFKATIEVRGNWACVVWSESVTFFGSTRSVKVKGTMNGVPFQTAFLPWGDGTQFLPVSKKLLKAMQTQPGDVIEVSLAERL